jgi:type VI secretion system secreted protein VgrG
MLDASRVEDINATFSVAGAELDVLEFTLERSMFELDSLTLRVVKSDEELPQPEDLIGKEAEFEIARTHDGQKHAFLGDVVSVGIDTNDDGMNSLLIEVRPQLWRLLARSNCRRFLKKTTPEVVQAVLEGAGLSADAHFEFRLSGTYAPHDVVTQYRETDWEFMRRLLSEAGIYFAPSGHDQPGRYSFSDDPKGLGACEVSALPFIGNFGARRLVDVVRHVEERHQVGFDKVALRDYDFTKPKVELHQTAESADPGPHKSEVYVFPGRFREPGQGKKLAQTLLESVQVDRDVVLGELGTVSHLPGYTFQLEEHPYAPLNQEYLVVRLRIAKADSGQFENSRGSSGQVSGYECTFEAIPTGRSPYRPPRQRAARAVTGYQTALTSGPSGEEIHTNEHGQVIAKFYWDRENKADENASAWMRTSQVPTGGSMLLPRMGWEVAVAYREGDVDQPYVISRLYNGLTPPPYALPENAGKMAIQTATTPGGGSSNELRMSDTKGSEEMFFNASRDMSVQVGNNTTESIGHDAKTKVGSNHKFNVIDSVTSVVGVNQAIEVGANQNIAVTSLMVEDIKADHSLDVGANRDMKVGGDHKHTVTGNSTLDVGANDFVLVMGGVSQNTLQNRTHDVGAALVEVTTGSRSLLVAGNRTESSGALKVIATEAGRGVESLVSTSMVGGAFITKVKGDRVDQCTGPISELAGGVNILKGKNITFEATSTLSLVMGAATITLSPASISVMGAAVKIDGKVVDLGIVMDN